MQQISGNTVVSVGAYRLESCDHSQGNTMYQSDFTKFMSEFLDKHPEVDQQRRELRLTLWDRKVSLDDQRRWKESRVPQKPYVYQPE
jgi:hypothetical protein